MKIFRFASAQDIELSGTTLTVYHRTKNQDIAGSICTVGFIAGGGAAYGVGIYSTYNLASSLKNSNLTTYGGEVLKATVDVNGFLIFNYELSKMIYGANYKLIDQVRNVIGENKIINPSNRQRDLELLEHQSKRLEEDNVWSSDIAASVSHHFQLDKSGVPGICFGGRTDGLVCVTFKQILITPVAHAWIDGRTYRNAKWEECPKRSIEELEALKKDDQKSEVFIKQRRSLLDGLASLDRGGSIRREDYPGIPDGVFDQAVANYLYEDESRIEKLDHRTRARLKDVIEIDFLIRKLKSAPTHYWGEWQKVSEETKKKIPNEIIYEIWADYLRNNKGHWKNVPIEIRPFISKTGEAKYWEAALKKSQENWKYIPEDIAEYMDSTMGITPPSNIKELQSQGSEERQSETEELEIPDSAISWVQDQIAKMNKRAGRLGLHPIILEVIGENRKERTKKVKVVGNVPYLKGYKLMARLEDLEDDQGNPSRFVETLSDEALPTPLQITGKLGTLTIDPETTALICQHCNMNRRRKEGYIIKNVEANNYMMVASSCLGDFIGELGGAATPDAIAKYASEFRKMLVLFREGNEFQGKTDQDIRKIYKTKGVPIAFFLSKVMNIEKQTGFVGRKEAYEKNKDSTAQLAWNMCIDLATDQKYSQPITSADISLIDSALAWISTVPEPPADSQNRTEKFLHSIRKSCEIGTVFEKKGKGNAGTVAWLPTAYRRNMEEKEDFSKLMGEKGAQIFFKGTLLSKKPVLIQISQQVMANKNTRQNYCTAESDDGRRVAWMEDKPIMADVGKTVFLKGNVDAYGYIEGKSSTHLSGVEEIPEQEYMAHEPEMAQKLSDLAKKHGTQPETTATPTSQTMANYNDGDNVEEDFTIMRVNPARGGQQLYFLQDNYGRKVSTFTNLPLGREKDKVRLSGTININKGYTNLVNVRVVQQGAQAAPAAPMSQYQNGQLVEDDFTILDSKYMRDYNNTVYTLKDGNGRQISGWSKVPLGNVGSVVRLNGVISIKGRYTNLTRIKVVPKQTQVPAAPTTPTMTQQTITPAQPVQPSPQAQQQAGQSTTSTTPAPTAFGHNWYKFATFKDFISRMGDEQEDEDTSGVVQTTVPDVQTTPAAPAQAPQKDKRKFKYPHEIDMPKAYEKFKDSYEKATGKAWTFDKFKQRAGNWKFYGNDDGWITVKEQQSGMYKLVGVAGDDSNPVKKGKALITALNDILSEGKPVWGMVSGDIRNMLERFGMKSPPPILMQALMGFIPQGVLGGAKVGQIFPDGAVELEYSDIGKTTKYFIGNTHYYHKLAEMVDKNARLPQMARNYLKKMIEQIASASYFIKLSGTVPLKNYLSIDEVI